MPRGTPITERWTVVSGSRVPRVTFLWTTPRPAWWSLVELKACGHHSRSTVAVSIMCGGTGGRVVIGCGGGEEGVKAI